MSKKLQGNGLWESHRMMLPQHKEQSMLNEDNQTSPSAKPPTSKEFEMMRDSVVLSVALQIVEKKSIEMETSSHMLQLLYSAAAKVLVQMMREDMRKLKKHLLEKHIRVYEAAKDDASLHYRFVCRGQEDGFTMTREFMRGEISRRIGSYVKKLVTTLHEGARSK
ncbi:hypothetical protein SAMN02799630_04308 [Paenibacillus sp. UNCCL117]|uniref:hypothetical protein n=1 Tax=unclassified Paenibacillus TaxID=185978 RepID=UPI000887A827|nr:MULTISPECIES: hypothetical protein [unclassified Paenibacillus]SDD97927.1 hypothetical protein SAMN04488602_11686 [Paenibacillus sp. cl123]SFW56079.1 hypothetical protein SAMN02799630_04308 [Paenibacillus sp. UNCCL117]